MATRITFKASVSFETDSVPVQTHRVEIIAATAQKAASEAVKSARRVFAGSRPRSIVVVLEETGRVALASSGKVVGWRLSGDQRV